MANDTDYSSAINEVFNDASSSDDDKYSAAINQLYKPAAKASIDMGVRANPDEEARNRQLSQLTGVPPDLVPHVANDLDAKVRSDAISGKIENSPVTKMFFADVGMVKVAHDDVDNLSAFENTANGFMSGRLTAQYGSLANRIRSDGKGLTPEAKAELDANRKAMQANKYAETGFSSYLASAAEFMGQRYESLTDPRTAVMMAEGAAVGGAAGLAGGIFAPVTVPAGVTAGMASGFLAHSALTAYEQEGASSYVSMLEAGVDEDIAQVSSRVVGVVNATLETAAEKVGLSMAAKGLKAVVTKGVAEGVTRATVSLAAKEAGKGYILGIGSEVGTEIMQEYVQVAGENIARALTSSGIQTITLEEANARAAEVAEKTFKGMVLLAAPGPGMRFVAEAGAARRGEKQHQAIISLHDNALKSTLQARDPELAAQFREQVLTANGIDEAIIDGEKFAQFFQAEALKDPDLAAKLDLTEEGLREAIELGAEVRLNAKGYAHLVGMESAKGLTDHIRLHASDMSAAQAKQYREMGIGEELSRAAERLDALPAEEQAEVATIRNEMREMLGNSYSAKEADFGSILIASRYVQRSAAMDGAKSPLTLWREDNLQVFGPGENKARPRIDDLGRTILKAQTTTKEQAEKGIGLSKSPIMDFLIKRGGIDPDSIEAGEVRNILGGKKARPGLFKKGGMGRPVDTTSDLLGLPTSGARGLDNIVQSEDALFADTQPTESGYVDPGSIYDMLREEVAGRPYRTAEQQAQLEAMDSDVTALEALLDEYNSITGNEVSLSSPEAEIRSAVEAMQGQGALEQVGDKIGISPTEAKAVLGLFEDIRFGRIEVKDGQAEIISRIVEAADGVKLLDASSRGTNAAASGAGTGSQPGAVRRGGGVRQGRGFNQPGILELEQKSRGSIIFGKDGIIIRLGADKDFSTFLHESGHLFLEQLRQDSAMSPKLKKDWDTVVEWWAKNTPSLKAEAIRMAASRNDEEAVTAIGMMTDDEVTAYIRTGAPGAGRLGTSESAQGYIGIAMHEQWARGVEDYFRTGRAPSIALQDAFNSFKAWIKRIYAGAMKAQLDVEFSPEVKGVMDRMIASDEDIAEVEYATNMQALFSDAESIGMTKETFKAYTESVRRAADESRARQLAKHIREENRIRMEWWKQEEEKVRGQIEEDVHARQEYVALYAITKGTLPDGAILDLPPGQMDRAEVVRLLGSEAALKGLAKNGGKVVYKKGGANPDVVAQSLGYADAMALLEALGAVRPMAEVIAEETEARMKEIHGDMLTDKNFAAENALKSTYHDLQGSVLIAELNALRKSTDMLKPAFVRQWAKDKLGKEVISRLQPRIFQAAERKHRKEAAKQFKLANAAEAARSKFRELMNFYMAKESINAKDEIDKGRDYLKKFLSPKKKWGGVDAAYIDKIRVILESVDLGPRLTNRQRTIEELKAINEWIAREQEDEGAILNIPERILRADTLKNYQNMTLDEFRELVDTVKMIETQGRKKKSLMIKGELVDREEKQKEILAGMADLPALGRILRESGGVKSFWKFDKLRHAAASFDAALTKLSTLAEVIDGTVRGPFWRYVVEPFSMAAAQESEIKREIVKPIIDLFAAMPSDQKKAMNDSVRVPSMGRSFTRSELIMIALNVGSQSNYDKMKDGSLKDDYAGAAVFTDQGISDAVNLLTDQELDIVEQVWRSFENTYPQIEEIYRRENGVAPARVEARTFTTASGRVLTGGYFPMMYDSARSSGGKMAEAKSALEAMQSAEVKASVFSGMTKGRTGFSAPVLLDIGRLPSQFSRVAHFISHYEAVRSSRLLVKGPVRKEVINKVGPEYADLIDNMLGYIANNGVTSTDGMDRLAGAMKSNVTASILAYSASTVFMQFLGITSAITGIAKNPDGTQSMSKASLQLSAAMARYLSKPKETRRFVMERSAMMKNRIDSAETMLSDIAADLEGESSKISKMRAAGFKMIAGAQFYAVDLPTWMAAYDKALQTMDEGEAALHADYIVETTQTGGGLKDKSMFQTKGGLWQMLQFFYAPMNVLYNMLTGGAPTVRPIDKDVVGRWAARYLVAIVVMTAMETAMKGWEDEDDDGDEDMADFAKSVAVKSALFPFALIPGVREIASGVAGDFGYSISPMASIGENTVKSYRSISSDIDSGEFSKASLKALASTLGGVAGLPSVQFNRLVELINAFYEGKEVGPRDFLFGYKDRE